MLQGFSALEVREELQWPRLWWCTPGTALLWQASPEWKSENSLREALPAHLRDSSSSNSLEIHLPTLHMLICPWPLSFKSKIFSPRSQVPSLPREVARHGACLLPVHLAGKPAGHRAGEPGTPEPAHLPACWGRTAAPCQGWAPGSSSGVGAPGSWQAVGAGQPVLPEPWTQRADGRNLMATHSRGCHGAGQILSLAAGKQPGWHGDRCHLTQPNQACWDFCPPNLSSGKCVCPRISYPVCLWLSKTTISTRKVHEVTISTENTHNMNSN